MRWLMQMVFGWRWAWVKDHNGKIKLWHVRVDPWGLMYIRDGVTLHVKQDGYSHKWKPYGDWSRGRMTKEFAEWMVTFGEEKNK